MKKIAALLSCLMLAGCATYVAPGYVPPPVYGPPVVVAPPVVVPPPVIGVPAPIWVRPNYYPYRPYYWRGGWCRGPYGGWRC